jgi:hypothetical protein
MTTQDAVLAIQEFGKRVGNLSLVVDARLWRHLSWRRELLRRVALYPEGNRLAKRLLGSMGRRA